MPPHGCDGHSHDHEHAESDDTNPSLGISLRPSIDMQGVTCLNEYRRNSCREILKLYEERRSALPNLLSPLDPYELPELLLVVPFVESVSIKSVCVMSHAGGGTGTGSSTCLPTSVVTAPPRTLRVYVNRTNLDFETVRELEPDAKIILVSPTHRWMDAHSDGTIDYPLRPAGRFQNVTEIALYFDDNYHMRENDGGEYDDDDDVDDDNDGDYVQTEITYVGFKGKGTNVKRRAVEATYETMGMKADHKQRGNEYYAREGL